MGDINFTQFLRSNGREREMVIKRPTEISDRADQLVDEGLEFHVEVLQTGEVSLTIHNPVTEEDVAIRIVPNGPEVLPAVDDMVTEFFEALP